MGEAKRRTARAQEDTNTAFVDRDKLAKAVRSVLAPVTNELGVHGADCALYAHVGAEVLRRLGLSPEVRLGDAAWRVGPGDGDCIHNAASCGGPTFSLPSRHSEVFHAWIVLPTCGATPAQLVDFTTWQLRDKARFLDLADGGHTRVEFCPDYLWIPEVQARALTLRQVGDSFDVGVFHYAPRPVSASVMLPSAATVETMANAVVYCYHEFLADPPIAVRLP